MELKIAHIYSDVLNLYGDQGNIETLKMRLKWRNIKATVTKLPIGFQDKLSDFDLFFIGGGQDFEQGILLEDLTDYKKKSILEEIEKNKTFLCICGGYQMMGNYYETGEGKRYDYIGAADFYTVAGKKRLIGNYSFDMGITENILENSSNMSDNYDAPQIVVGFENHSGKTYLGKGIKPLGKVIKGYGNNGEDGTEGVRYKNLFGTYSHGPVLPKNPYLADNIILTALENKYGISTLSELDNRLENLAHSRGREILG